MRQEIYEDDYGFDAWDLNASSRCFVHILNSNQWKKVTGQPLPGAPPSASDYTNAGLPWFEYYDDKLKKLKGSTKLSGLDSVAAKKIKLGEKPLKDNESVEPTVIQTLGQNSSKVTEGQW